MSKLKVSDYMRKTNREELEQYESHYRANQPKGLGLGILFWILGAAILIRVLIEWLNGR